jgi:hypothetical protein
LEHEALGKLLLPKEPEALGAVKNKLLALTHLVENDLAHDNEPFCAYMLIAIYKEDPRIMELLPAACAYLARKYPKSRDWAVGSVEQIETRLRILKSDPAEADKRWASCAKTWPEAHAEAARARSLFELMARKAGPMPPPGPSKPERHASYGVPEAEG